ncbi:hypothetical protein [Achromobacter insuavis]|uniref:hypothetical protein n=1 Tax=Achromobacter insuavis TaxID=1287735 RepID=UPI001EEC2CDC|nr:hypothetical protein [Achromobacter insuavis]
MHSKEPCACCAPFLTVTPKQPCRSRSHVPTENQDLAALSAPTSADGVADISGFNVEALERLPNIGMIGPRRAQRNNHGREKGKMRAARRRLLRSQGMIGDAIDT